MSKSGIALCLFAVILAATYVFEFTDWFHKDTIQIIAQIRPGRASSLPRDAGQDPVFPVSFAFDGKYRFTSIKVVSAGDQATNKYPAPLWHLISDSNSVPVKAFVYGYPIKGMRPAIQRARPEPLLPDVDYVLMIEAGAVKAQTNFHTARAVTASN